MSIGRPGIEKTLGSGFLLRHAKPDRKIGNNLMKIQAKFILAFLGFVLYLCQPFLNKRGMAQSG